ncbi:MAG: DUF1836 domain-containing protein [Clostridia bacterium]|nr:DUF1836 domain-containing protein [Clostridia bacterium]
MSEALPAWESLPDFGLYMDQLLTFTERCFPGEVTAGMINSYVKTGLVDRPQGKKYSRAALARLLMVCCLKQATPLDSLRTLIEGADAEALYTRFRRDWTGLEERLPASDDLDAMGCAILAAAYQNHGRKLLRAMQPEQAAPEQGG